MKSEMFGEIHSAEMQRSLSVAADAFENDDLSLGDMINQIDALIEVAEGKTNFAGFAESTNLNGRERLN